MSSNFARDSVLATAGRNCDLGLFCVDAGLMDMGYEDGLVYYEVGSHQVPGGGSWLYEFLNRQRCREADHVECLESPKGDYGQLALQLRL